MAAHEEKIIRFPEVKKRTSLSRSTIWRLEQEGSFPQRVQLSPNAVGWKESDIRQWLDERLEVAAQGGGVPLNLQSKKNSHAIKNKGKSEKCPFCGMKSNQILTEFTMPNKASHSKGYQVECINCGARGPCGYRSEKDASLGWGCRA